MRTRDSTFALRALRHRRTKRPARLIEKGLPGAGLLTQAIESPRMQLRKIIKNRGRFHSDEAAAKLVCPALRNITARWKAPSVFWRAAMNQFAVRYAGRFAAASVRAASTQQT